MLRSAVSRISVLFLVSLLATPATGSRLVFSEADLDAAQQNFPGLMFFSEQQGKRVLTSVGKKTLSTIYREIESGRYRPEVDIALRIVLQELSERTGAIGVEGRRIMEALAGIASESGSRDAVRGVAALLSDIMAIEGHAYSIQAEELLTEKVRCGAGAVGDLELVEEIARLTSPSWSGAIASNTDGTVADRYGLHRVSDLYSLAVQGDRIVAAGYFGSLLVSVDGGQSWGAPETGTDEPLYAVALDPNGEIWAAGRRGTVLHSADGVSVARSTTPFDRHYFGIVAPGQGRVRVVGDFGLQLASEDGGVSWRCVPREEDVILGRISPAGPDYVAVGEFATIERLPGGDLPGERGAVHGVPEDFYIFDAWLDATGEWGVAVGLGGTVVRTDDGGANWERIDVGLVSDLYGVGGRGDRVAVVGEGGTLAVSEDRGRSFELLEVAPLPLPFYDVAYSESDEAFIAGPRGLIGRLSGRVFEIVHPTPPDASGGGEVH